ncbi:MAG: phytoene desaturase family protein [Chitinophagales bacterium]
MHKPLANSYCDVAIIGAGIGGLTAAALLSKLGFSVCVLEKEPHVGGYLAGFKRKGFRFDTAIHWLNQYNEKGLVSRLFDVLGKDHPIAIPQVRIRRYLGDGFDYLLTNNPDQMKEELIASHPHEQKGIERFFQSARKIGHSLDQFGRIFRSEETMSFYEKILNKFRLLKFALPFIPYLLYSGKKGFAKGLRKFFKDEGIHKIFSSETELLSCLIPIGWAYYGDFQSPPAGGGQVIPEWLKNIIEYYHNDIFCSCQVDKIILEGNHCKGVTFKRKGITHTMQSKYVIAASDVETLYEKMLPPNMVPDKLKRKLKNAELYSSSVTISIALDCPTELLGFNEELIHLTSGDLPFGTHADGDPLKSEISILAPSKRDKSLAPEGKGTLTLYMPACIDYENGWSTQKDDQGNLIRGDRYKKLKNEIAEAMIKRVEEKIAPGLKSHILFYEVATPVTHLRYTGNRDGSIMGAKPGRKNMSNKVAHYQTPVKNLILGGHWAELGGGVPIAVKAASNATLLILKKEKNKAFQLLADYMENKIGLEKLLSHSCFKPYDGHWKAALTTAQKYALSNL